VACAYPQSINPHPPTNRPSPTNRQPPESSSCYKVFDLSDYRLLHALPSAGVRDVKMSGQLLAVVKGPGKQGLPLELVSAENGQVGPSKVAWMR